MQSLVREWITALVTVALLGTIVDIVLPKSDLRKYTRFVINIIMLVVLLKPVIQAFGGVHYLEGKILGNSIFIDMEDIRYKSDILAQKHRRRIEELFRENLEKQIENHVKKLKGYDCVKAKVYIVDDKNSASYCSIERIELDIGLNNTTYTKPIRIKVGAKKVSLPDNELQEIKEYLSAMYGVPKDKISIN